MEGIKMKEFIKEIQKVGSQNIAVLHTYNDLRIVSALTLLGKLESDIIAHDSLQVHIFDEDKKPFTIEVVEEQPYLKNPEDGIFNNPYEQN